VFASVGIPHPHGANGIHTTSDLVDALVEMVRLREPDEAIVKLDESVSGFGNAVVDLRGAADAAEIDRRVHRLSPENQALDPDAYLEAFERDGGIVEERISGDDFCSPSVQVRASPEGGTEVLSTHDQIMGGPTGQMYFGCKLPADPGYAVQLGRYGRSIADHLAQRGVIGRFAIDFVATRKDGEWDLNAVEINLRNGGTTHPALTLMALTDGDYNHEDGTFLAADIPKHYVATDHLEVPELRSLTPDDVLDLIDRDGLGWDNEKQTGAVLHLVSGVAVAGRVGVTAIGNSAAEASAAFDRFEEALTKAASGQLSGSR
jgi:PGM1 C-terminal domain